MNDEVIMGLCMLFARAQFIRDFLLSKGLTKD